ncbi:hypothetical protein F5888DRAFT_1811080 [Russula emetica]|nr:hypothetical protein F5888DRAFT_1811080 [Russula emetica]
MDSTGGSNEDSVTVTGASHAQSSRRLSQRAEPRPTEIHTISVPGAAIRVHQAKAGRRDISQYHGVDLDPQSRTCQPPVADYTQCVVVHPTSPSTLFNTPPSMESQDAQGVTSFWPMSLFISMQLTSQLRSQMRGRNKSPLPQVDLPRDRAVIRHRTEQLDCTVSTQTSFRLSAPSPSPPKQQSASTLPLQSLPAPAIAKTASRRMHTPRNTLPYEPQEPSSGTLFESSHPPGEDRGKARPKEESHKGPSAAPHGLTVPPEYIPFTTKLPSMQDYNYPSAAPHRPLPPTERIPTLTGPPSRQCRNSSSVSHGLPAPPEDTHTTTDLPSLQDYKDSFAASHKPPVIPGRTSAAAEPPSLPQLVSGSRRLDLSNSPLQGENRIDRTK